MQEYSQRIKERLANPRFLAKDVPRPSRPPFSFDCLFEYPLKEIHSMREDRHYIQFTGVSDRRGCIKSLFYTTSLKDFRLAFLDTFAQFAQEKKRYELFSIEIREIENYLRDRNQFPLSLPGYLEDWVLRWINLLIYAVGESLDVNKKETMAFPFSLVEKIHAVEKLLNSYIRPLLRLDQGDVELIDIRGEQITLLFKGRCRHCKGVLEGTMPLIEKILRKGLQTTHLKLVAE
ncbi:MAG: NifU family protein [Halobacteriovoraceae bacterium]|nr:NifU family protein [Halobacteriovoraceae bacterium]